MSILDKAKELINGPRQKAYGPPTVNFQRIAMMWSAYLGKTVSMRDVCNLMILLKVSREANTQKLDNLVDIAGYAGCAEMVTPADDTAARELPEKFVPPPPKWQPCTCTFEKGSQFSVTKCEVPGHGN